MVKTVEQHGVTFYNRKPEKPGVYLCVQVDRYTGVKSRIETVYLDENWALRSGSTIIPVQDWLTRGGQIRTGFGLTSYYFTEKTLAEMNA